MGHNCVFQDHTNGDCDNDDGYFQGGTEGDGSGGGGREETGLTNNQLN